jgi:hypothetical protein
VVVPGERAVAVAVLGFHRSLLAGFSCSASRFLIRMASLLCSALRDNCLCVRYL